MVSQPQIQKELIPLAKRMLGIPFVVWGILGLVIATIWLFVWPSDKVAGASTLQFIVLRWFHALVWLLLSAAAFAAATPRGARMASVLGWSALATYVVFVAVMLTSG